MKIVTERGIVTAKFIAENQQVKEALETNMQLLKDSLEKQGLSVQGFSVSVGQDSYRGFNSERQYVKGEAVGQNNEDLIGGIEGEVKLNPEKNTLKNPYEWESSEINLTA